MFAEYIGEILRFSAAEDMTWTSLGESCWIGLGIWNPEDPRSHARHQQKLLICGWVVTHSGIGSPNPQDSSIFTPQQSHPPDMKHSHSMVQTLVSRRRVNIRGMGFKFRSGSLHVPLGWTLRANSHGGQDIFSPQKTGSEASWCKRRRWTRYWYDTLWCMVHWDMYLCYYTMLYLFMCVHV